MKIPVVPFAVASPSPLWRPPEGIVCGTLVVRSALHPLCSVGTRHRLDTRSAALDAVRRLSSPPRLADGVAYTEDTEETLSVPSRLMVAPPPLPRQKQESSQQDDYYVNAGYAIRSLREELPGLFSNQLDYSIYRDDITFSDPVNTFSGLSNYKLLFWALRFNGRVFFRALRVDVQRIWQPADRTIMVRWSVKGMPRVPWQSVGHFDGTSEYSLDSKGKIYEHRVDNVVMSDRRAYVPLTVADALRLSGTWSSPTPTGCRATLGEQREQVWMHGQESPLCSKLGDSRTDSQAGKEEQKLPVFLCCGSAAGGEENHGDTGGLRQDQQFLGEKQDISVLQLSGSMGLQVPCMGAVPPEMALDRDSKGRKQVAGGWTEGVEYDGFTETAMESEPVCVVGTRLERAKEPVLSTICPQLAAGRSAHSWTSSNWGFKLDAPSVGPQRDVRSGTGAHVSPLFPASPALVV